MEENKKTKLYNKSWFIWVTLIFFLPLGIFLLWKNRKQSKKAIIAICVIFATFFISYFGTLYYESASNPNLSNTITAISSPEIKNSVIEPAATIEITPTATIAPAIIPTAAAIPTIISKVTPKPTKAPVPTKQVTTAPPAPATAIRPQVDNKTITVYISKKGKIYHRAGCRHLNKDQTAISLETAKAEGYEPCSICNPPQ